jgi:prepilin-type N-terminal cleavage/methylation domain-containing protein
MSAPYCSPPRREGGFTLIEMIVVTLLLSIAMVGLLAVFDASARINKNESEVADAQGAVRYGVYQMTRTIRMAGTGGLFVTQAVLNRADPDMPGMNIGGGGSFDNIAAGSTVADRITGANIPIRPGTDAIEIRGVIFSPLLGFDKRSGCTPCSGVGAGCNPCTSTRDMFVSPVADIPMVGSHVNHDVANRPQFSQIDAYTAGATPGAPMYVFVAMNSDIHAGCIEPILPGSFRQSHIYPQPFYAVGRINAPTDLISSQTIPNVDFDDPVAQEFVPENPADGGLPPDPILKDVHRAGILDDILFFVADDPLDPNRPFLAQAFRRGDSFDVVRIAEDVEDMQIAYGIDTSAPCVGGLPATAREDGVSRTSAPSTANPDPNISTAVNDDEWRPNAPGEAAPAVNDFQCDPAPNYLHTGVMTHCPRLKAVQISLIAKSAGSDPANLGPQSRGIRLMNSPVTLGPPLPDTARYPSFPGGEPRFRRRVQTLRVDLRNYGLPK